MQLIFLKIIKNYNGENSYLFVNGTEIHKFKAKNSEIVDLFVNGTEIHKFKAKDSEILIVHYV